MQDYILPERGIAYRTNTLVPGRPTLLYIHGLSGSLSAWYPYEPLFEQEYNLVTLDLRGHGLSVHPGRSGYAMREFVEDIRALLAHLRIERCTVVSHSFGTLIAMEFARAHPAAVERMVYLAPAFDVRHFIASRVLSSVAAALAVVPLRLRAYRRTDYRAFYPTADYSPGRIAADIANMGLRSYLFALRVIFEQEYTPHWREVGVDTLVVHGSRDRIVPVAQGRALAAVLPHARLVELPEANHILVLNNIPEVARLIREFVGQ